MAHWDESSKLGRRTFLAGAAAGGISILRSASARTYQANSKIELGLIGCGGRGNWITKLFEQTGKYRFVACSDYFQDRVDATGERLKIPTKQRYTALSGYKRLLEDKLDAVVVETPPYFHPEQAAAAVAAGKHVFLAKPIAVDVPGCQSIAESGKQATANKLVFLVDFQTRANQLYREALRKVRAGDIGRLVMGEAHYPWQGGGRGAPPTDPEQSLRQWYYVLPISGDFVNEQAIHALDIATWIADADPICAFGTGGRTLRPEGSIWDHFAVNYRFPNDFVLSFTCIQSIPGVKDEISCRVFGADGVISTDYFGDVWIRGKKPYEGGSTGQLYTTGAVTNINEFSEFIANGNYANETVAPSVRSNLTAVLARTAGYRGGEVTWKEMIEAGEKLEPNLKGLKM
jgi:myo-inositol 2-dehydrogenase / D-chiro-inositol 1-dehydrogenase